MYDVFERIAGGLIRYYLGGANPDVEAEATEARRHGGIAITSVDTELC